MWASGSNISGAIVLALISTDTHTQSKLKKFPSSFTTYISFFYCQVRHGLFCFLEQIYPLLAFQRKNVFFLHYQRILFLKIEISDNIKIEI